MKAKQNTSCRRRMLVIVLLTALWPFPASADRPQMGIEVVNQNGEGIEGALVILGNFSSKVNRKFKTDVNGKAKIDAIFDGISILANGVGVRMLAPIDEPLVVKLPLQIRKVEDEGTARTLPDPAVSRKHEPKILRICDSEGKPLKGARVSVEKMDDVQQLYFSDNDGKVTFDKPIDDGADIIVVNPGGDASVRVWIDHPSFVSWPCELSFPHFKRKQ